MIAFSEKWTGHNDIDSGGSQYARLDRCIGSAYGITELYNWVPRGASGSK